MIFTGCVEKELFDNTQSYHSDIPGLDGRAENHLEFLGLYGTKHGACKRHHIPAIRVSIRNFHFRSKVLFYDNYTRYVTILHN